jgi:MFS family permease
VPLIAAEYGWSASFAMGGFSLALLVAGLVSPLVGRLIDRHGGHRVMPVGSLLAALGLVALTQADHPAAYLAVWMLLGVAIAASLYDPAFATLGRIFGAAARPPITALTLAGGFASTVSWPLTHILIEAVGWRGAYFVHAALLVLAAAFAAYAFVPSGMSAHLLAIFGRAGIDPATAVAVGALFGPAQVAARICEFTFARHLHPLSVVRFAGAMLLAALALIAVFGLSLPTAAAFAVMFGVANGLITIGRGTVPLALFGAAGYGALIGRIAAPSLTMQAIAPLVLAVVAERVSDAAALMVVAALVARVTRTEGIVSSA